MKRLLIISGFLLACCSAGFAQDLHKAPEPVVHLDKIAPVAPSPSTPVSKVSLKDLQSCSKVVVDGGDCKIDGFSISFLPKGKDFIGPFTVEGSGDFTQRIKAVIANLGSGGGRVFIENIHVNCNNSLRTMQPMVFTYN